MFLPRHLARHGSIVDVGRLLAAFAVIAGASFVAGPHRIAAQTQSSSRAIVVAELFTSEGCSSCPPADDLLAELVRRSPVPGVEVLALSEHVDYWDRLGWSDPFSSTEFSLRQSDYDERVFRTNRIYTPQLVVDGQFQAVGSDAAAVRQALLRAARMPKAAVTLATTAGPARDRARLDVRVSVAPALGSRADLLIAIVEDDLVTHVLRGENGGRTLRHTAVVRILRAIGALAPGDRASSMSTSVLFGTDWAFDRLRVIAFLQERDTRRIIGAAAARVAAESSSTYSPH